TSDRYPGFPEPSTTVPPMTIRSNMLAPLPVESWPQRAPRVSRVALVLTLSTETQEGHQPYPPQSGHPAKETTWGGASDDPRREHTGAASARHAARRAGRQREPGLSGVRNLPDAVLPVAA